MEIPFQSRDAEKMMGRAVKWEEVGNVVRLSVHGMECAEAEHHAWTVSLFVRKIVAGSGEDDCWVLPEIDKLTLECDDVDEVIRVALLMAASAEFIAMAIKENRVAELYKDEGLPGHARKRTSISDEMYDRHVAILEELNEMQLTEEFLRSNRYLLDMIEHGTFGGREGYC